PIEIGPFSLRLTEPMVAARDGSLTSPAAGWDALGQRVRQAGMMQRTQLEILGAGNEPPRWGMDWAGARVGRAATSRGRRFDESVSGFHCSLVGTPSGIWVVDLLSRTGTWVNGQLVRWARVAEGSTVQVGPYYLRFYYEGADKPASAVATVVKPASRVAF